MHDTVKAAWMLAIAEMETGTLTHEGASLLLKQVERGVTELEGCMTHGEEGLAAWEKILGEAHGTLGRLWVVQQQITGRRDKNAMDTRKLCRGLGEENMRLVRTAQAWKTNLTELATLGLQQMALLKEAANCLHDQDHARAAEYLRRHLTLEAEVERLSPNTGTAS